MKSNKSINKIWLFTKIWLLHIVVYYTIFVTALRILERDYEEFYMVLLGFVGGITGIFEQLPGFVLIPILTMAILLKAYQKNEWFKAYLISISFCYLINYTWMLTQGKNDKILFTTIGIDLIYVIIPSLLIAILGNWLFFRNDYKQVKEKV